MPQKLLLTNDTGTETIDLLNGSLRVKNWDWQTQASSLQQRLTQLPFGIQASSVGYPQVVETLSLAVFGCAEEIRVAVRQLESFLEHAKAYMDDPIYYDPHWLEWRSEGEDGKRVLVCGGAWTPQHSPPTAWQMLDGPVFLLKLALTRHPLWEDVDYTTVSTEDGIYGGPISTVGGTMDFTVGDDPTYIVAGGVPARLALMNLLCDDVAPYGLTTFWMGYRPEYYGLTNFNPVWQCQSLLALNTGHSVLDVDTTDHIDATAYNGYTALVTFDPTDTDMDRRLYINLGQGPNKGTYVNASHFAGRYLVLCRCFSTLGVSGTIYPTLQMRSGYSGAPWRMTVHDPVLIDNSAAHYVELGQIQIPPPGMWDGIQAITGVTKDLECTDFTIELYAQSLDPVETYLDLDVLVLIPTDYFIKLEEAYTYATETPTYKYLSVVRNPDERLFAYSHIGPTIGGEVHSSATAMPNQWYIPAGASQLVLAAERSTGQDITDEVDGTFVYYPRWTSYRE